MSGKRAGKQPDGRQGIVINKQDMVPLANERPARNGRIVEGGGVQPVPRADIVKPPKRPKDG